MDTDNQTATNEQVPENRQGNVDSSWKDASGLPCQLTVALPVTGFKVQDLMELEIETVVETRCNTSDPVPVWVNSVRVGDAEFDVLGTRLAIRMNEVG